MEKEEAIFAAGCFWGVEQSFRQLPGVLETEVGYTGGEAEAPSYKQVCSGVTGHYEAVHVWYDPKRVDYAALLRYFFSIHDPTQRGGQGPDIGPQYQSAIFYKNISQQEAAESLLKELEERGISVSTKLLPASTFWRAEEYHQRYHEKK